MKVARRQHWDPEHPERVAARLARLRPDAVFLGGLIDTGGAEVVRALRRRLGTGVRLLATDGLTPTNLPNEEIPALCGAFPARPKGFEPLTFGSVGRGPI